MPDIDGYSNHTFMQTSRDHWKSTFLDRCSPTSTPRARMAASEDWRQITDSSQRKKVQNRIAQRTYRNKLKRRIEELEQKNGLIIRHSSDSNSATCQELYLQGPNADVPDSTRRNNKINDNEINNGNDQELALMENAFGAHTPPCQDGGFMVSQPEFLVQIPATTMPLTGNSSLVLEHCVMHSQHETPPGKTVMSLPEKGNFDGAMQKSQSFTSSYNWPLDGEDLFQFSPNTSSSTNASETFSSGHNGSNQTSNQHVDGRTTLHLAVENDHFTVVKMLLERKADVTAQDRLGVTPLHIAASKGYQTAALMLLGVQEDLDITDVLGCTALHRAAENGHVSILQTLLENAASGQVQDNMGATALHLAASNGHEKIVAALLTKQADSNIKDQLGSTALHRAAENGHHKVVQQLLELGSHIDAQNSLGWTALHFAASKGHESVVQQLLAMNAEMQIKATSGWTALHMAGRGGHERVVAILLSRGADPNSRIEV